MTQEETRQLRARLDTLVASLASDYPDGRMIARALLVKACEVSLATVGPLPTTWMTTRATNLLAGHWCGETIDAFMQQEN